MCTSDDVLRKRGPPSKRERALMNNAGIVFRSRNSKIDKQSNRQVPMEKETKDSAVLVSNVQNQLSLNASQPHILGVHPLEIPGQSGDVWGKPGSKTIQPQLMQPDSLQSPYDVAGMLSLPPGNSMWMPPDSFTTSSDPLMPISIKNDYTMNSQSGYGLPSDIQGVNFKNESETPMTDFNPSMSSEMQVGDSSSYPDSNHDFSLLTRPMDVVEQSKLKDSEFNEKGSFMNTGKSNFDTAKMAVQDVMSSTISTDLSTKQMLDYCTLNNMGKPTGLPPRVTSIVPPNKAELGEFDDVVTMCVLSRSGTLEYQLKKQYYGNLEDLYNDPSQILELPGDSRLSAQNHKDISIDLTDLFPSQERYWHDSDYFKLNCEASALLQVPAALILIRTAIEDLDHSLPFFQAFEIENYVSNLISSHTCPWTPVQMRQRMSILLLLCALGSSLTLSVNVLEKDDSVRTALPWEFGFRCYQLARGLLSPAQKTPGSDEMTMETLQCMILMHMYMNRCGDRAGSWSPLTHGNIIANHILKLLKVHQEGLLPTQSMLQWEMIKRCIWVLYIQEVTNRIEGSMILPQCIWTHTPLSMEMPVHLHGIFSPHGPVDELFSSQTINRFIFHIELCHIFVRILQINLDDNVNVSQNLRKAASIRAQLLQWDAHTPCMVPVGEDTTNSQKQTFKWTGSRALDGSSVYLACANLLSRAMR